MSALKTIKGWLSEYLNEQPVSEVIPERKIVVRRRKVNVMPRPRSRSAPITPRQMVCDEIARNPYGIRYEVLCKNLAPDIRCEQLDILLKTLRKKNIIELRENHFVLCFNKVRKYAR